MLSSFAPVQHSFDKSLSANYQSSGPILLILDNSGDQKCSWVLVARFDANKSKTYMLIYVVCIIIYIHSIYSLFSKRSSKYIVVWWVSNQPQIRDIQTGRATLPTPIGRQGTQDSYMLPNKVCKFSAWALLKRWHEKKGNDVSKWTTDSSCWWLQPFWIVWSSKSLQLRLW